jgi:dihydrofolate reductase
VKSLKAIVAMAPNRVIGRAGHMPWHLREDLQFFKKMTTGNTVVMGRKTFESMGRPLPNRTTVVISRGNPIPGTITLPSLEALDPEQLPGEVFIAGGAQIYSQTLDRCSDLYLTLVHSEVDGDTFFPPFEHAFEPVATILSTPQLEIVHYRKLPKEPTP